MSYVRLIAVIIAAILFSLVLATVSASSSPSSSIVAPPIVYPTSFIHGWTAERDKTD
jgi:uncharacterized alpha/beta hydrolase family protein